MCILLDWQSKRMGRVVKSTFSAELTAAIDGIGAATVTHKMLLELTAVYIPLCVYVDNKSLVEAVYSTKAPQNKRLRFDITFLRATIDRKEVSFIPWIQSEWQSADCLTKTCQKSADLLLKTLKNNAFPFCLPNGMPWKNDWANLLEVVLRNSNICCLVTIMSRLDCVFFIACRNPFSHIFTCSPFIWVYIQIVLSVITFNPSPISLTYIIRSFNCSSSFVHQYMFRSIP